WHGVDEPTRQAIELELDKVLAGSPATDNPVGGWFTTLGSAMLLVTLIGTVFLILLKLRVIRG
ncbi:MAG TPA: hypothetical protein VKE94_19440, partial [Gemmataceae bacterium]|nr:hypothetical protein [Gemmataceae bacterium]